MSFLPIIYGGGRALCFFFCLLFIFSLPIQARRIDSVISLELRHFPEDAEIFIDEFPRQPLAEKGYFKLFGEVTFPFSLRIEREGYKPYALHVNEPDVVADPSLIHLQSYHEATDTLSIEVKLEPSTSSLVLLTSVSSGRKPKAVAFSPDGDYFFVTQLDGYGIDIYDSVTFERKSLRLTPDNENSRGYVEFAVLQGQGQLWVSQMETAEIHVIDLKTLEEIVNFSSHGLWTKVICFDREERYAFVSNWLSEDITIFDTRDYSFLGSFSIGSIPRGLAVSPNNRQLFVADYEEGRLLSFDISFLTEISVDQSPALGFPPEVEVVHDVLDFGPGAKRHVVIADSLNRIFVSDMYHGRIFVYDLGDGELIDSVYVGQKLNTIVLDPGERFLYISSRGRNNPENYLIKGPDFGKIFVMDTQSLEIVDWVWGRNQPTGLAVSPQGNLLVFSDFLDSRLEIYTISARSASNPLVRALGLSRLKIRDMLNGLDEPFSSIEFVQKNSKTGTAW